MSDPLRDVVSHWAFEWRACMVYLDHYGVARLLEPGWVAPTNAVPPPLADHPANVGPLLSMLQRYDQHVMIECYPGSHWECQRWDDPSEEWISEEGPTPCQALCLAILALPPASKE